jgi:hypothetical protein
LAKEELKRVEGGLTGEESGDGEADHFDGCLFVGWCWINGVCMYVNCSTVPTPGREKIEV